MRVLVFASQKGGVGKTTLAGHIGVQAERAGAGPVALVDTDPQGSLAKWWNCRREETPAFLHSVFTNLVHDLDEARAQGFKLVVVDTPPAVTKAISEVIAFADLVVLPTRPSPHDLRAVGPTIDICEARRKPVVFVLNAAMARARITMEAAVALSQHGTVAPTTVHNRTDFAASMIDGRTVMEADPEGKSAEEIAALWDYLQIRLLRRDMSPELLADGTAAATASRHVNHLGRVAPAFGRRAAQL
jgi:chromosome partitioning protein